jgi:hypothetical protein
MKNKTIWLLIASLLWIQGASATEVNEDRYDGLQPKHKLIVRIGGNIADSFNTTMRFDSRRNRVGTVLDLEDDFNVDSNESIWQVDGLYRFNERHHISFNSYSSRRSGKVSAGRDFEIGDPDKLLSGVIPVNAEVHTKLDFDLFKLGYGYSFINRRKFEANVNAGVNFRNLDFSVAYKAQIGNRVKGDIISSTDGVVPLPTFGIGGRWNFTEKLEANYRFDLLYLESDDYEGYYQEALLGLEHNTFKNVGFGLGMKSSTFQLHGKEDDIDGELNSQIFGLLLYLHLYL